MTPGEKPALRCRDRRRCGLVHAGIRRSACSACRLPPVDSTRPAGHHAPAGQLATSRRAQQGVNRPRRVSRRRRRSMCSQESSVARRCPLLASALGRTPALPGPRRLRVDGPGAAPPADAARRRGADRGARRHVAGALERGRNRLGQERTARGRRCRAIGGKNLARPPRAPSDSGLTKSEGFADLPRRQGILPCRLARRPRRARKACAIRRCGTARRGAPNTTIATGTCEWLLEHAADARRRPPRCCSVTKDPRDMALASLEKDTWIKRGSVGGFGWRIKGLPGDGRRAGDDLRPDACMRSCGPGWKARAGCTTMRTSFRREVERAAKDGRRRCAARRSRFPTRNRLAAVWDEQGKIMAASLERLGKDLDPGPPSISTGGAPRPRTRAVVAAGDAFLALWTQADAPGPAHPRDEK